ncbi:uncharacterized protein LY79DRAFT_665478 [Colletotrichum navitas]|uniref:Uncharacterized protein n=1 Tax=Colletotrichum navitas TaxID=681940 RepID=A0AAD8V943_9PEZI|nr:uncharacterized protein LY79DRAFT_665478 [Colletotrichum navitas]KAK1598892.1 hypothetical protein LY79DRAFT_665478 [Colletotrichum navitas]
MPFSPYADRSNASAATTHIQGPSLMSFIWDVAFIAIVIVLVKEAVRKMTSPKDPGFVMGTKSSTSPQATTAWGSYCTSSPPHKDLARFFYKGSHEQFIGISRAAFLRFRKRQQVREYYQRSAVEASFARLLQPASWGRSEREEERDTAVRFAEVIEYIPPTQTPLGTEEQQPCHPCRTELGKPTVNEEAAGTGSVEDDAKSLGVTGDDSQGEIVKKIWGVLRPEET